MTPNRAPLKPHHHLAAQLLGEGRTQEEAAQAVEKSKTALRNWLKRDDFAALVKAEREKRLDEQPSARATLEQALTAVTRDGQPAWAMRIEAAKVLMLKDPGEATTNRVVERIYVTEHE
jgi:hypothetical protein